MIDATAMPSIILVGVRQILQRHLGLQMDNHIAKHAHSRLYGSAAGLH